MSHDWRASILASAMDAIITVDEQQRIVLFNSSAERVFLCSVEQALGQPLNQFIPHRFRAAHEHHVRHYSETGETRRIMSGLHTLTGLRANGEEFPMEASLSRVETGGVRLFTVILRDITEKQALLRERQQAQETLAKKAEELARSNQELEQFAYVASHDLQEPLRMVASYTQLLAERCRGKLDENADKYINYAVEGAMRMQTLIQDLLAFSRVGRNGNEQKRTDCNSALEEVRLNLRAAIEESQASILSDGLPTIAVERSQIVQLLQNLIGNAIKFRGTSPPVVRVSAQRHQSEWVLSVTDNGIGIAPEHRDVIFVIFQRLHTRSEYPGNGVGLAICKKIVEQHGGRIWVESETQRGSTFYVSLPACEARAEEPFSQTECCVAH